MGVTEVLGQHIRLRMSRLALHIQKLMVLTQKLVGSVCGTIIHAETCAQHVR